MCVYNVYNEYYTYTSALMHLLIIPLHPYSWRTTDRTETPPPHMSQAPPLPSNTAAQRSSDLVPWKLRKPANYSVNTLECVVCSGTLGQRETDSYNTLYASPPDQLYMHS